MAANGAYGTARWLIQDPRYRRDIAGFAEVLGQKIAIEKLERRFDTEFGDVILRPDLRSSDIQILNSAMSVIETAPTLAETVLHLVRAIHLLEATEGYDASYSSPDLPFSVFLSLPDDRERDPAIRAAESMVHEAMHLQLSLIERHVPLAHSDATAFSPWKQSERPASGLLHGLYVFSVLYQFFSGLVGSYERYAQRRRGEIEHEIGQLPDVRQSLTPAGARLWDRCFSSIGG